MSSEHWTPVDRGQGTCPVCGSEFKRKSITHKRCSSECTRKWQAMEYQRKKKEGEHVVYMLWTDEDERVYIGSTSNYESRVLSHRYRAGQSTSRNLAGKLKHRILARVETRREMLYLEQFIMLHLPPSMLVNVQ